MNKELLLEGAVAGHMNHIYDNGELTFGKLKEMLQAAVNGDLRGTEKTDGQNIFLSFNVREQKAKAVRNKTQIKAGGLNVQELDEFFSGHPSQALRHSFVEALRAFEKAVKSIDEKTQFKIFGQNNEIYYNTEVMNPGNPDLKSDDPRGMGTTNVIPYDKKTLLIHDVGHKMFNVESGMPLKKDVSKNFQILRQALQGSSTEDPTVFSIETHQERELHPDGTNMARELLPKVFSELDSLISPLGLDDSDTINNFVVAQIGMAIDSFNLNEETKDIILRKVMGLCLKADGSGDLVPCGEKEVMDDGTVKRLSIPNPNINKITKNLKQETAVAVKEFASNFKYGEYVRELQLSLYDFSVAILQGFKSNFIADNEKQINFLKSEVQKSIEKINSSSNLDAKRGLQLELEKLKNIENINTPSEGFVFDFEGFTYKFTGAFGPANQILGMERYERYGKIEPLKIGVLAGAFKPPHIGHYNLLKGLFSDPQAAVDVAYLAISNPVAVFEKGPKAGQKKAARFIPIASDDPEVADVEVTSDNALQIWSSYIDRFEFRDKVKIVKTEHASPIHFISDLVSADTSRQQSIPADMVPPPGSKIYLAVSSKGNDAKRFGSIISSDNTRKDISVINSIAEPVEHSANYINNLRDANFANIVQNLPNLRNNPQQFHASDMRYLIGAAKDDQMAFELLKDFVPDPKDAAAVLSIFFPEWTERAMDTHGPIEEPEEVISLQSDQEPDEISLNDIETEEDIYEVVTQFANWLLEKKDGKFQKKMKKRLKKSHSFYLDQGRKDLIKYGRPFSVQRVKNKSNAFLAENADSTIEEFSGAAAAVGYAVKKKKKIEEKEKNMNTKSEKILRLSIRKALKKFFEQKKIENEHQISEILEEHDLRISLRNMIIEQAAENPSTDPSDNTGINTLKDLLKGTNVLATLRNVYKTLTTDDSQKKSFRAHIVRWIQDTLTPVKLNDVGPGQSGALAEQVDIDIEGIDTSSKPEDRVKFIDALDGSEKEEKPGKEEEEEGFSSISGADKTGRNKAERVYPTIEKSIISYYGELDNPEDMEMFYDYLVANVKLYFDKWDGEMNYAGEEPTNDEYEQAKQMA